MKIICLADVHACKEHEAEVMTSLREVKTHAVSEEASLVAIAGDFYDAAMQNSAQGGLDRFLGALQSIANCVPVVMVEGTPSHDVDGSLEVIKRIDSHFGVTILETGKPYFLSKNMKGEITGVSESVDEDLIPSLLILGIPEPRKKYLLANGTAGKDATEEAVRNAMHLLCFQLAAIRKQYADLPCLVVYHGDVAGTTLQNDQTVERGTGIAITIDDLASIGADYYALGHIHKPQHVGNLPAYYAGSVYAKNFGETHKPGCNLVEIIGLNSVPMDVEGEFDFSLNGEQGFLTPNRAIKVSRIDFSHPQNLKIEARPGKPFDQESFVNRRVWIEIHCTKEEQAFLDPDKILADIMRSGAVPGSRVTVSLEAVETVRAADITGTSITPEQKFEIWAEQSALPVTDSLRAKIKELENASERAGATISGEWALVSVRLRGATGIWKGIRKDEIFVNFDEFDNGLIALSGKNGKGKTTFIENCHSYPQLLTRKGTLKEHFRLRDSFREVIYRDVSTGAEKRFLIQIDGFTKSGGSKYFIFDRAAGESEWIPMPGIDGNLAPYEDAVKAVFGPLELYLRTAFITQRPNKDAPDLTEATKTEKKMLFANLAGIDYLQKFADAAKENADKTAAESHDAEIKIGMLENSITIKEDVVRDIGALEKEQETFRAELETVKTSGTAAKNRVEKLQIAANAERARSQRAAEAELALGRLRQEMDDINHSIADYEVLSGMRPEYETEISRYESLKGTIESETEKLRAVEKRNQVKTDEYRDQMDAFNAKKGEIEKKIAAAKDELRKKERTLEASNKSKLSDYQKALEAFNERKRSLESEISQARIALQKAQSDAESISKEIRFAESAAPKIDDACPTCKQKLPAEKITELTQKRKEALQRIEAMQIEYTVQNNAIAQAEARLSELEADFDGIDEDRPAVSLEALPPTDPAHKLIDDLTLELAGMGYDEPIKPTPEPFDDVVLSSARSQADVIRIDDLRANLTRAAEASARIEGYKAQIVEKNRQIVDKQGELDELVRNADPDAITDLELAKTELNELMEQYRKLSADLAASQASLEAQKKRLSEIEASEAELKTLRESVKTAKTEFAEWDLLRRAFGPDGIQALELDALAPGIAEVANDILTASFGDRFRVEFQTTRIAGTGKKTKQVEDFLIYVIDTQDGESTLLENKSGGEAVWIKRAIYSAFAIIRARNTGFRFLTSFQDESDGALDSASKVAYAGMLAAEHETAKLKHTVIITHSEEVKAMIEQKIDMESIVSDTDNAGEVE